ncbi:MAG: hypothetical protein HS104_19430 [Polyangiaceae bacterium]|nr:hypothetical protein [Polyangiaceae bacterium]MCE7889246.1 hypothetical protein [Sorangiineae bacterium PRO1]MCL4752530.1 hypothetical protein [Myxococcales bacterium]
MKLRTLLLGHHDDHSIPRIGEALDRMDPKSRLAATRSATKEDMATLWELMKNQAVDADFFVPSGTDPLKEVIHEGKNSLPAFTHFQKRFCRADDDSGDVYGYNHGSTEWLTGPGYFVAHAAKDETEPPSDYLIDYTRVPPKKADGWPEIRDNDGGIGALVYGRMKDYMRKVSTHVSIGKAYKRGKEVGAYFLLCRQEPE